MKEMFTYCDGLHISLKKVLCSMGGIMQVGEMIERFPGLNKLLKVR